MELKDKINAAIAASAHADMMHLASKAGVYEYFAADQKKRLQDADCPGDCDWRVCDDSYDDAFGTVRIAPYLECNNCTAKKAIE